MRELFLVLNTELRLKAWWKIWASGKREKWKVRQKNGHERRNVDQRKKIETQLMRHVLTSFYSAHNFIKRHLLTGSLSEKFIFSKNAELKSPNFLASNSSEVLPQFSHFFCKRFLNFFYRRVNTPKKSMCEPLNINLIKYRKRKIKNYINKISFFGVRFLFPFFTAFLWLLIFHSSAFKNWL